MSETKDLEFLKEMKQRLLDYRESGDHEQLNFVEQMINDWIDELQE